MATDPDAYHAALINGAKQCARYMKAAGDKIASGELSAAADLTRRCAVQWVGIPYDPPDGNIQLSTDAFLMQHDLPLLAKALDEADVAAIQDLQRKVLQDVQDMNVELETYR